jgi:antitoxin component of MazEF toxin-antitoxin module
LGHANSDQEVGKQLGARIPRALAEDVGVDPGSKVSLSVLEGELIVIKAVDTGEAVGVEIF